MFLSVILTFLSLASFAVPQESAHPPSHLVIGLDGVSLKTMLKLYEGGHFRDFHRPSAMISSFPSISDPNWNRLVKTPVGKGYTKSYFDVTAPSQSGKGQIQGTLIEHLKDVTNYERGFDFKAEGVLEHLVSVTWIETTALYWLDALEKSFFATKNRKYFYAFIINTDLLVHVQGEAALIDYLAKVDERVKKWRTRFKKETGKDLEVTIVSDHGNSYRDQFEIIPLEETLKKKGWNLTQSLSTPKDVVFVGPEILSFAALYCLPESSEKLAVDVAEIPGVHLASYEKQQNEIHVFQKEKQLNESVIQISLKATQKLDAQISSKEVSKKTLKERFVFYKVLKGKDPLNQGIHFKNDPISWQQYLDLSHRDDFPYSAVRIWEGFHVNSVLPGQVLASAWPGHAFDNPTLRMLLAIKGLRSMHGSLQREESTGVVISTREIAPIVIPETFGDEVDLTEFGSHEKTK